jgi:hypothetical protein
VPETELGDYDVVLRRRGDLFYALIPELALVGRGPTPEAAWAEVVSKYATLRSAYDEAGALDDLPAPDRRLAVAAPSGTRATGELGGFLLRTAIVCIAVLTLVWGGASIAGRSVAHSLQKVLAQTDQFGGKKFWGKVESEITKAADREVAPEKQAEITGKLHRIVTQVKPFTDELAPLFSCPAAPAGERRK